MGLFSGSMTYRRFLVEPVHLFREGEDVISSLSQFKFKMLEDGEVRKIGWVNPFDLLDTEFRLEHIYLDNFLLLALRVDEKRIPTTLAKATYKQEVRNFLKESGKEGLSKRERELIRERVGNQLAKNMLPNMRIIEAALQIKTGEFYLFSASNNIIAIFEEAFKKTFNSSMLPYTCGSHQLINLFHRRDNLFVEDFELEVSRLGELESATFSNIALGESRA